MFLADCHRVNFITLLTFAFFNNSNMESPECVSATLFKSISFITLTRFCNKFFKPRASSIVNPYFWNVVRAFASFRIWMVDTPKNIRMHSTNIGLVQYFHTIYVFHVFDSDDYFGRGYGCWRATFTHTWNVVRLIENDNRIAQPNIFKNSTPDYWIDQILFTEMKWNEKFIGNWIQNAINLRPPTLYGMKMTCACSANVFAA